MVCSKDAQPTRRFQLFTERGVQVTRDAAVNRRLVIIDPAVL